MKLFKFKYIFLCFLLFAVATINAQQRKIQIEYSGFLTFDEANYPGAKILTRDDSGQVHIIHDGVNMWCDQAIHYSDENFIEAYGNVNMKQGDTINMGAKYVEYSGKTQLAFASGDVVLTEPSSVLTTDTLYFDREKQQSFYKSGGTVVRDSSGTITSRIGRYYMNIKKYQFIDSVKLVNPDYILRTQRLDYFTENGHAYMYGPSTITGDSSKIYCERGYYDTENDIGYFIKKSRIDYDNRIFEGDSMYFDRNSSFASATNNIKVTDTLNNSVVKGHYAEVFREKDSVFITKRALAITVQEKDSIYMHGDTLMVTGDPEHRITRAFRNVKMYKSDMSGKADSVHVNHEKGLTQLINISKVDPSDAFAKKIRPILWNLKNQMTGDTIHLISNTETEKLDTLLVFNNAFLISKDTLDAGYNQISGQRLIGLFNEENQLHQVDIIKNAESIYYFRNDENELVGIDKSKSGRIRIFIKDNAVEEVRKINQIDGNIYPESQFPENAKILKGFVWREDERPNSVEDLFKDDPPLNLPKIKGLSDYIEAEDFFDDNLLERIKKADEADPSINPNEPKKASRHLPEDLKSDSLTIEKPLPKKKPNSQ
ncbi:OstA-like protein [Yeosuana sp. MJ-SS3]|uniref:OstA-like protein n=1 Tax=Gilvirhabdus luticola TaxID=3079858 RepID=A0ABU3U8C8_9FLAO|nr:OstA-like protein [Yeosuana sp. MJ-SS3]MDU8886587.1 OstA-like protein [Yeosuana sp. MJ-SS3]